MKIKIPALILLSISLTGCGDAEFWGDMAKKWERQVGAPVTAMKLQKDHAKTQEKIFLEIEYATPSSGDAPVGNDEVNDLNLPTPIFKIPIEITLENADKGKISTQTSFSGRKILREYYSFPQKGIYTFYSDNHLFISGEAPNNLYKNYQDKEQIPAQVSAQITIE